MGFRKFTSAEYEKLEEGGQRNIMALVGNGFDIQVTNRYGGRFSPRYEAFYHYLKARNAGSSNLIVDQMEKLKDSDPPKPNWSDLEYAIGALVDDGTHGSDVIFGAVAEIQAAFSEYLELVAPPALLTRLGADSSQRKLAVRSLTTFIQDIVRSSQISKFRFPKEAPHYQLFNFLFVNFNYTPLLDDYIYLDHGQWDPHPHKNADRNVNFKFNPTSHPSIVGVDAKTNSSSYVRTEIVHPHGQQAIPRSLLFGIDAPDGYDPGTEENRKLMKPFWAMNTIEYGHYFPDVELFIIFGCSLGETDGWWWRRILEQLEQAESKAELVIYWYNSDNLEEGDIVAKFLKAAGAQIDQQRFLRLRAQIQVVLYTDQDDPPVWLATPQLTTETKPRGLEQPVERD